MYAVDSFFPCMRCIFANVHMYIILYTCIMSSGDTPTYIDVGYLHV